MAKVLGECLVIMLKMDLGMCGQAKMILPTFQIQLLIGAILRAAALAEDWDLDIIQALQPI